MTRPLAQRLALIGACLGVLSAPAVLAAEAAPPSFERYRVIAERNIFLRDRTLRHLPSNRPSGAPSAVPHGEPWPVLRGIMGRAGEFVAILEDPRTGATTPVRAGADVAGGRVVEVAIDHIVFASDTEARRVDLGWSLAGQPAASEAAGAAPPPSGAPPGSYEDILARMRQRREQELRPPAPPTPPGESPPEGPREETSGPPSESPSEEPGNGATRSE